MILKNNIINSSIRKQLIEDAKDKANQRVKAATKADEILKELRTLRDQKGPMLRNMN